MASGKETRHSWRDQCLFGIYSPEKKLEKGAGSFSSALVMSHLRFLTLANLAHAHQVQQHAEKLLFWLARLTAVNTSSDRWAGLPLHDDAQLRGH